MTKSGFKDLTKSEIEEGVKSGEIKRSLGRKANRRLEMKNRSAGGGGAPRNYEADLEDARRTYVASGSTYELENIEKDRRAGVYDRKPPRGSMKLGLNKVGPQTADLKAAIARKVAMAGNTPTAAAQQGGGNTQVTNITKNDGDVTHMPKSDIRNNKFATLNRSAYAQGAI